MACVRAFIATTRSKSFIFRIRDLTPVTIYLTSAWSPFRTRTADLEPPFRSLNFRRLMLPRYRALSAARSPYIRSVDDVDAEIAARFAPSPSKPGSDAIEHEPWREPSDYDYPDPPPPPDAPRGKPVLRVIKKDQRE